MTVSIFKASLARRIWRLFSAGEQGAWFDISDIATLFQDSVGTTSVTAAAQPDGLALDKSKGFALGLNVVVNGDFSLGTDWGLGAGWSIAGGSANASNASTYLYQINGLIIAKEVYSVTYTVSGYVSGTIKPYVGGTASFGNPVSADGTYTAYICAAINGGELGLLSTSFTGSVDNIIVKKLLGSHATQITAAARPTYQISPARLTLDKIDDSLSITVPTGGFVGTMVLSTTQGTAAYGVNIPAGTHTIGGLYFPGPDIVGQLIRHGTLSDAEIASVSAYMVSKGGGPSGNTAYVGVTDFTNYWRGMSGLTAFPLLNTSAVTNFSYTWYGCSSLTSFPAVMFNTCPCTNFTNAFVNCALTQTSVDNILVSIAAAGTSNGTLNMTGGTSATPSAAGLAAKDALVARGWTITHN